jgi:prevent-host-death family protein
MKQAGAFYVKTHLSALLEEVEKGETIEITKRGKPVARIVPVAGESDKKARALQAVEYFKNLKPEPLPKGVTIKSLINQGRKY